MDSTARRKALAFENFRRLNLMSSSRAGDCTSADAKKGPWFAWKKLTNKFKKQSTSELKLPNVSAIPSTGYSFIVACLLESLGCLMLFTSIWYIYIYPTHPNTKKWLFVVIGWLVHPFSTSSSHPILPRFWSLGSSPKGAQARLQRWKTAGNGRDFGIAWLPAKC